MEQEKQVNCHQGVAPSRHGLVKPQMLVTMSDRGAYPKIAVRSDLQDNPLHP
jgi:hypothetical protein